MAIPSEKDIQVPLLRDIEAAGGSAKPSDLYDKVARHFPQLTMADQKVRHEGSGIVIWQNRVQWARQHLVNRGEIDASTRGIWKITDKGKARLGIVGGSVDARTKKEAEANKVPADIKTATEATDIALSYVRKYFGYARPIRAVREDDIWLVEVDVGALFSKVAKAKVDAKSGSILEYVIPQ